jgi:pyrroloquinoline-quinone synthase
MNEGTSLHPEAFLDRLRSEGRRRYHDRHPFHTLMHEGRLTRRQLQAWVANRYYYQTRIPIKDALILSKSEDPAFRRAWIRRIVDHDGSDDRPGGIADWLKLAEGVGLDAEEVKGLRGVLPGVRAAGDAYVALVRERSLVECVAASLTEFFSPELMSQQMAAWRQHYPWVSPAALAYFTDRVPRAKRDAGEAVAFVLKTATTREAQDRCVEALIAKCAILWALLDAIHEAEVAS